LPVISWGDVPTWALAAIALLALIAAVAAYFKQADAASKLAEQVDLQRDQLRDQQKANSKQAEVLEVQLREIRQRAEAVERQQADAITAGPESWGGTVPGVEVPAGRDMYAAVVGNESRRPIRNVACRIEIAPTGDALHPAALVGLVNEKPSRPRDALLEKAEDTRVRLLRAGSKAAFVFVYDIARHPGAKITARFTDDAGLHWQIDHDLHLQKLDNRDDW
jgi:hypothetical protein